MNISVGRTSHVVRHAPFSAASSKPLSTGQINSNKLNTVGRPRDEACNSYFKAMGLIQMDQEFRRGMAKFNEVFRYLQLPLCLHLACNSEQSPSNVISCLVHKNHGAAGKNCARCVGLGDACSEVNRRVAGYSAPNIYRFQTYT